MMTFIKMLVYEIIDISDGSDVNKSHESKKCMLCHYWYYLPLSVMIGALTMGHIFVMGAIT